MLRLVLVVAALGAITALNIPTTTSTLEAGLGDGVWRTFSLAISGKAPPVPHTQAQLEEAGWNVQNNGACDPNLGILYTQDASGPSKDHPLGVYVTSGGQMAGLKVQIWGESWTSGIGPAGQPALVDAGLWIKEEGDSWVLSVSTRAASLMCSGSTASQTVGDRVVINQGGANVYLPMTAQEAHAQKWQPGSCMKTMGQHWFLDLKDAPNMSWQADTVLPVVAMYWPPDMTGTLQTIFFTTPVAQKGSYMMSHADWETPFLPAQLMCENWCNKECHWNTDAWSTMHIYFASTYADWKCPGGSGLVDRSCPSGELGRYEFTWEQKLEQPFKNLGLSGQGASGTTDDNDKKDHTAKVLGALALSVGLIALVVAIAAFITIMRAGRRRVLETSTQQAL